MLHGHSAALDLAAKRAISSQVACQSEVGIFANHSSDRADPECVALARADEDSVYLPSGGGTSL
jgi:hypothetical protein